jgi:hypothetical protein
MSDDQIEYQVPPLLLTMRQAADLCQVGLDRMREWTNEPGFPVIRTSRQVRIPAKPLEAWLAKRAQEQAA